ncbi:MAG TPA: hypothetical protein VNK91_13760 [Burkholderiaceae bacterium]|jgi:flagellar biosynthesis chaperone FliJ|nr:hypothetical protein [Burkholderiaceae bacterium]
MSTARASVVPPRRLIARRAERAPDNGHHWLEMREFRSPWQWLESKRKRARERTEGIDDDRRR